MANYIFGIDLGTTYSCIAYQDSFGKPIVVKNLEGHNITPSVVRIDENESDHSAKFTVGSSAKDQSYFYPKETISFIKTKMGKVTEVPYGESSTISPIEVSSLILRKLANDAGQALNTEVKDVVITVPAYFGDEERKATKQAGEVAGLNVLSIIDEPTAAAIFYGFNMSDKDQTVLVYDLGGGTFDVSVMKVSKNGLEIICTDGNHDLGGKDWDKVLMSYIKSKFESQFPDFEGVYDEVSNQELAIVTEKIKMNLSQNPKAKQAISISPYKAIFDFTREEFDEITQFLLDQTLELTKNTINLAKERYNTETIDKILLVGGSTRMPQVKDAIVREFDIEPVIVEPDEAVAKGAAIYATIRAFDQSPSDDHDTPRIDEITSILPPGIGEINSKDFIKTKSSKSFGIAAFGPDDVERIYNLILKNTTIPQTSTQEFATRVENQSNLLFNLLENTSLEKTCDLDFGKSIGNAELLLPSGLPKGSPIDVTIEVTDQGTVILTGREVTSNKTVTAKFESEFVLRDDELAEMKARNTSVSFNQ